jgi:hypothetical protein
MGKWSHLDEKIITSIKKNPKISFGSLASSLLKDKKTKEDWRSLRIYIWRLSKKNHEIINEIVNNKWNQDEKKGLAEIEIDVSKPVKSLEDLIEVCDIDLDIWEIDRWVCNTWGTTSFKKSIDGTYRTNYQVKAWLSKRTKTQEELLESILPIIEDYIPKKINKVKCKNKIGVASFADFHIGAEVKQLLKTKDFNIEVLINYLQKAVYIINSHNYSKVHVNMLGDFFESLSGINHENTFKSLMADGWGANAIIMANEIIGEHLLSKINNLTSINIVSGNHDRMTASNKVDNTGEGGKVLWYMLKKDFPTIPVRYHNSVLSVVIDGISYLLTHGDKGYSKKEFSKFVLDYGIPDLYNLVMEGHLHSRVVTKAVKAKRTQYEEIEAVSLDDVNYRKIVCASIFTGNWFSESIGYSSAAGLTITENNGDGKPNVFDYSL